MANTIPGGAYQIVGADGSVRWVDAEGKPLDKEQIAEAQRVHAENAEALEQQEQARIALEAQRNPTAQAIAAAMAPKSAPAKQAAKKDADAA